MRDLFTLAIRSRFTPLSPYLPLCQRYCTESTPLIHHYFGAVNNSLSCVGVGEHADPETHALALRWIIPQYLGAIFLVVSLLQIGEARLNFSRLILESPFLNVIGKASYAICKYLFPSNAFFLRACLTFLNILDILQYIFFNFYIKLLYHAYYNNGHLPPRVELDYFMYDFVVRKFFQNLPGDARLAGFSFLIIFSWCVHTYYQDYLVASVVGWIMRRCSSYKIHGKGGTAGNV